MAKRIKLEPVSEPAGTFIGIATSSRDYRLVHFMNKSLNINLASKKDIPFFIEKTAQFQSFPFYEYHHTDLRTDILLIGNYNGICWLIPSLKQLNYFLLLRGAAYKEHIDRITLDLRSTQGIQAALPVVTQNIREMDGILQDLEMHLMRLRKDETEKIPPLHRHDEE